MIHVTATKKGLLLAIWLTSSIVISSVHADAQLIEWQAQMVNRLPREGRKGSGVFSYGDSATLMEFMYRVDDSTKYVQPFDLEEEGLESDLGKKEADLYVFVRSGIIDPNGIKQGRRGRMSLVGVNSDWILVSFNVFVAWIGKVKIVSVEPPYCKLFAYSELWRISRSDLSMKLLDTDDGYYLIPQFKKQKIIIEVQGKGERELFPYKDK